MFKRGGKGVKGTMNNVKKNCKNGIAQHPIILDDPRNHKYKTNLVVSSPQLGWWPPHM